MRERKVHELGGGQDEHEAHGKPLQVIGQPHAQGNRRQTVAALEDEGLVEALRQPDEFQQQKQEECERRDGEEPTSGAPVTETASSRMLMARPPGTSTSIVAACVATDSQKQRRCRR